MPTTVATLGRERTLSTLARRVYQIEGRGSAELQRRAEAALLRANPRLSSAEGFRAGDKIVVPAVPGLERSRDEISAAPVDRNGLNAETALRLEALGSRIQDRFRLAADERRRALERLDDDAFVAEARQALPSSIDLLAKTRERLKREEQQDTERSDALLKGVASALDSLKALEKVRR